MNSTKPALRPTGYRSSLALPYKHIVAIIFVAALFLDLLDMTVTNVAMPAFERAFGGTASALQWVTTIYLLAMVIVTPVSGWVGDRFGTKRAFLAALFFFSGASALCAVAWNLESLIVFRAIQGAGGGLLTPIGFAMLLRAYPVEERATASAVISVPAAVAPALGPVAGGYIVERFGWSWVFLINVPVGCLTLAAGLWLLREHRETDVGRLDWKGFLLAGCGMSALLYALAEVGERGAREPVVWALAALGVMLLTAFVFVEQKTAKPMIDVRLFANRAFTAGSSIMLLASAAFSGVLFLLPLLLQMVRGFSAFESGLVTAAHAVGILIAMPLAVCLYRHIGARWLLFLGMIITALATAVLSIMTPTPAPAIAACILVAGFAFGLTIVPLQTAPFASLSSPEMGRATAVLTVARQIGLSVGVAFLATVLSGLLLRAGLSLRETAGSAEALGAFQQTFLAGAAVSVVAAAACFLFPVKPAAVDALRPPHES